ncbi:MAG: hypothetical protein ACLP52_23550, partial [Streptosporangiaceae bacterium]
PDRPGSGPDAGYRAHGDFPPGPQAADRRDDPTSTQPDALAGPGTQAFPGPPGLGTRPAPASPQPAIPQPAMPPAAQPDSSSQFGSASQPGLAPQPGSLPRPGSSPRPGSPPESGDVPMPPGAAALSQRRSAAEPPGATETTASAGAAGPVSQPDAGTSPGLPPTGAAGPLPQRGPLLPRRTGRSRPAGRHRSPHRLTVPPEAPSLVLAVPGSAAGAPAGVADEIAAAARLSCPGVDVRVGFLAGDVQRLADTLVFPAGGGEFDLRAVMVPALLGPHPRYDPIFAAAAERASAPVMLAAHLGPHPLLAEAMHARLADAGLARSGRARGLSIVSGITGVLVLADRGEDAVKAAGVSAVLLAARLAIPATPASLGDPESLSAALARLREAGALHPVISPCVIGPETDPAEIEDIRAMLGAPMAPPLGAHPAIGQLVAIRYGAALARVAMASSAG